MKKPLIFLSILIFGGITIFFIYQKIWDQKSIKIRINNKIISAEIATTSEEETKGLSGRAFLDKDKGMLFVFDTPNVYSFTMRGMEFPLDFIWILDNQMVDLSENIAITTQSLSPKEKVNYVLEVNAGTIQAIGAKIGDRIEVAGNQ